MHGLPPPTHFPRGRCWPVSGAGDALQHGTAVEWQFNNAAACQAVFPDAAVHGDGAIAMPDTPGFGLTPDVDMLRSLAA